MKKLLAFFTKILLRFYMEIIVGFWDVFIIIPIDSALYKFFTGVPSYNITTGYWIFFGFYTTFFIISGASIPMIKIHYINKMLSNLTINKKITLTQKEEIMTMLKQLSTYKPLTSYAGFINFVLDNIFSLSIMFAWFGIEGVISNTMSGESLVVPVIFIFLFLSLLILHSFLDDYIAQQTRLMHRKTSFSKLCSINRILAMQIVADIGGGGNSDKMGQLLLEQVVYDIEKIINLPRRS